MKKILIALVAIFALTQCKPTPDMPGGSSQFASVTEYGLYAEANPTYIYNIELHQFSVVTSPTYRFIMQTDDQKAYLSASIKALPREVNLSADVDITMVGKDGFKDGVRSMKLVKIDAEKAWLWSETESIGIVVAVPLY